MKKDTFEELKGISPLISKIKKPPLPQTPEMYFEGFEDRLLRKLNFEKQSSYTPNKKEVNFISNFLLWFAKPVVSLSFVLCVMLLSTWLFYQKQNAQVLAKLEKLDQIDLYNYVNKNIEQFDTPSFIENAIDDKTSVDLYNEIPYQNDAFNTLDENIESIELDDLL